MSFWVHPSANIIVTIVNLITGTRLGFYSNPDSIADSVSATFEPTNIRGRSSMYHGYDYTGPRATALDLPIHEDLLLGGETNIVDFTNKVRALAYPEYAGQVVAPRCYLQVGQNIRGIIIVNSVGVAWSRPIRNNRYINASLTIDCTVLQPMAPTASMIEGGVA